MRNKRGLSSLIYFEKASEGKNEWLKSSKKNQDWIKRLFDLHAFIVNVEHFVPNTLLRKKIILIDFLILCKSNFIETYFIEREVFLLLLR